jgi:hypothetical protein
LRPTYLSPLKLINLITHLDLPLPPPKCLDSSTISPNRFVTVAQILCESSYIFVDLCEVVLKLVLCVKLRGLYLGASNLVMDVCLILGVKVLVATFKATA